VAIIGIRKEEKAMDLTAFEKPVSVRTNRGRGFHRFAGRTPLF
jgi:hypothetical protein